MANNFSFHPEALFEYAEATNYYLREALSRVATAFSTAVESAIASVAVAPDRWRIVESPGIRRFLLSRFPSVIEYRWESNKIA